MPPKKKVVKEVEPEVSQEVLEDTDSDVPTKVVPLKYEPTALLKSNAGDSDRLKLAAAINNLVFKGSSFVEALTTLTMFTNERMTELDMQLETKKNEYKDLLKSNDNEYKQKMYNLETEYSSKKRALENDFKNSKILIDQQLSEYKLKACKELAGQNNMLLVEKAESEKMYTERNNLLKELTELKNTFTSKLSQEVAIERNIYKSKLEQETNTINLSYKATTAELNARVTQQTKEIEILNKTIETLKNEIMEQRNLTREIANAGAKGQITQNIGKN